MLKWLERRLPVLICIGILSATLPVAADARIARAPIHVSYVSASAVYVDAGSSSGLAIGDHLDVKRDGEVVAVLEVVWVAEHSASCILINEIRTIKAGDLIAPQEEESTIEEIEASPVLPEPERAQTKERMWPEQPTIIKPSNDAVELTRRRREPFARISGSASFRLQSYQDGVSGRGFDETTGRLSLRMRGIGGHPLQFRARLRSRDIRRDTTSERDDRLYELALLYDPPEGRFSFQVGRLGASPFLSLGYLDGGLAAFRFNDKISAGVFAGSRPDLEELGFASAGEKYGSFFRFEKPPTDSPFRAEAVVAAIGEYVGGTVNREYVSIESRLGTRKWSFSQLAEVDLNSDWRLALSGQAQQISNLSFAVSYRPRDNFRANVSYDRRQRFRTLDTRPIPEEQFDDKLRQGLRLGLQFGRPRGWNASTTFGFRNREEGEETVSFAGSVYNTSLGNGQWLVGADVSGYQTTPDPGSARNGADGLLVTLRARRAFRGGHDVGVVLGSSSTTIDSLNTTETRSNQWARVSSTFQLPKRLFVRFEIEYNVGDDLEGQRVIAELGRRF